jgi:hypothetical protein
MFSACGDTNRPTSCRGRARNPKITAKIDKDATAKLRGDGCGAGIGRDGLGTCAKVYGDPLGQGDEMVIDADCRPTWCWHRRWSSVVGRDYGVKVPVVTERHEGTEHRRVTEPISELVTMSGLNQEFQKPRRSAEGSGCIELRDLAIGIEAARRFAGGFENDIK